MVVRSVVTIFFVLIAANRQMASSPVGIVRRAWRVSAFAVLCFLPGYRITYSIFDRTEMKRRERIGVSILLSCTGMICVGLYLTYAEIHINTPVILWISVVMIAIGGCLEIVRRVNNKKTL